MDITVIDVRADKPFVGRGFGPGAAATHSDYVTMTSAQEMVDNVLAKAAGGRIRRLHIWDHGNAQMIELGDDEVRKETLLKFRPVLRRLAGHFTRDGAVYLHHCDAGRNDELMQGLAWVFNTKVIAGTGFTLSVINRNFGQERHCTEAKCWTPEAPIRLRTPVWDNRPNKVCCFPAYTAVHTPYGLAPIQALRVGDAVWAWDAARRRAKSTRVVGLDEHAGDFALRALEAASGAIQVTDTHRFGAADGGWVASEEIRAGFAAAALSGPLPIRSARAEDGRCERVFNLRLEAHHGYFVGAGALLVRDH